MGKVLCRIGNIATSWFSSQALLMRLLTELPDITPLGCAAFFGQDECCRVLINANADINLRNARGRTANQIAQKQGLNLAAFDVQSAGRHSIYDEDHALQSMNLGLWNLD